MFVCCVCCVLWGRGLCDELIPRPEECYWLWRFVVCDHETSWYEEAIARAGLQSQRNKQTNKQMWNTDINLVILYLYFTFFISHFIPHILMYTISRILKTLPIVYQKSLLSCSLKMAL
jgi:hypothetical protein